jgi:hypothetical protein
MSSKMIKREMRRLSGNFRESYKINRIKEDDRSKKLRRTSKMQVLKEFQGVRGKKYIACKPKSKG